MRGLRAEDSDLWRGWLRTEVGRNRLCSFCARTIEQHRFQRARSDTVALGHRGQRRSVWPMCPADATRSLRIGDIEVVQQSELPSLSAHVHRGWHEPKHEKELAVARATVLAPISRDREPARPRGSDAELAGGCAQRITEDSS